MADIKLSQLGPITTLEDDDIILISQNQGGGSFTSKSITVANFTTEVSGGGAGVDTTPTGTIHIWPQAIIPAGYLECNGAAISRTTFADLFALLSSVYGNGNGSTTFNIPDYRGEFLRGWSHGSTNDPDRLIRTDRGDAVSGDNIGTKQSDQLEAHLHNLFGATTVGAVKGLKEATAKGIGAASSTASLAYTQTIGSSGVDCLSTTGGNENRPRNINVMYLIKT